MFIKPFWTLLRLAHRKGSWFTRGLECCAVLTHRCNYHCKNCPMFIYGEPRKAEECSFEEWKSWFERFPFWLSLVYISGGETSLYKDIVPLVNWLVERGHRVVVYTNLMHIENFDGIKNHWRVRFCATFHEEMDNLPRFTEALKKMQEKHYVYFGELGTPSIEDSMKMPFYTHSWYVNKNNIIHFAPDSPKTLKMYSGCSQVYR